MSVVADERLIEVWPLLYARAGRVAVIKLFGVEVYWRIGHLRKVRWLPIWETDD